MYVITTEPFGPLPTDSEPLTEYFLEDSQTGEFVTIIPQFGAVVRRLVLRRGNNLYALLRSPDSPSALLADESYASALLFPFPSRVRHGVYSFEGESYALRMNETSRDNALHGFVNGQPFTVISQEATPQYARLILSYDYAGDTVGYPFPFNLIITYELSRSELRLHYSAMNTGQTPCPVAFGWHPYFSLTDESIDDMTLSFPARTPIALDEYLIPNGHHPRRPAETLPLRDVQMDTPFALDQPPVANPGQSPSVETVLTSLTSGARLVVGQETGPDKLNYLVCYTPGRRDSIAIEPQTANVDAFNTGEGLTRLDPGDALSGKIWVRLD